MPTIDTSQGIDSGDQDKPAGTFHLLAVSFSTMRVLLLALMIALLPLRVWVGDAMAMEQMSSALSSVHAAASMPHDHQHDAQPCHEHAPDAHPAPTGEDNSGHAGSGCASCTVCQICHSVALTGLLPLVTAVSQPTVAPHTQTVLHASAERAPGFKPPIS